MRKIYLVLMVLFSCKAIYAQDYKLFNASSVKVFTEPENASRSYSMAFDSVVGQGFDSVYYTYTHISDSLVNGQDCYFWGPEEGYLQNMPIWIGGSIRHSSPMVYKFITNLGDTLNFDFLATETDTTIVQSYADQSFKLVYLGKTSSSVLGFTDSLKHFKILHYDANGQPTGSNIDQKPITIGKMLGLLDFFRIDSFPVVLQPLTLLGQTNPDIGLYVINGEKLYDHQVGDVIQICDWSYSSYQGTVLDNSRRHSKYTYLSRTVTDTHMVYLTARERFSNTSPLLVRDTITLSYSRFQVVHRAPFDSLAHDFELNYNTVYNKDFGGIKLWAYANEPGYLMYCPQENCWGEMDTNGPPADDKTTYVCGLGLFYRYYFKFGPGWQYADGNGSYIEFFIKNGFIYGNEVILGLDDIAGTSNQMTLFPNPCINQLRIQLDTEGEWLVSVYDLNGKELVAKSIHGKAGTLNVTEFNPGLYIIQCVNATMVLRTKFIKN